jgi:hypothetical protein
MKDNGATKSKEGPKTIWHGNAAVKLYRVKSGDYTLLHLGHGDTGRGADGKRKLRQFADETEAKREVDAAAGWTGSPFFCVHLFQNLDLHRVIGHDFH